MESIHSPKKPGAARAGVLAGGLLLALLLALPGAWYARYHDQLTPATVGTFPRPGAVQSRPSGLISLAPPALGKTRTVQIRHMGGQVVTTINDGNMRMTMRAADPRPPSNPLDALGQSLCDRYNAWKCAQGDPHQSTNLIGPFAGSMTFQLLPPPNTTAGTPVVMSRMNAPAPPPAPALGTRAPESFLHRAAHTPARP